MPADGNVKQEDSTVKDQFEDLNSNSFNALIVASDTVRDIGYDTFNASMGKLSEKFNVTAKSKFSMKLCPADARSIAKALHKTAERCRARSEKHFVSHRISSHKISYKIDCIILAAPNAPTDFEGDDFLGKGETFKFKLLVSHENSRMTEMQVKINRDRNGFYWLSVLANPTSLLNAYNAHAIALPDTNKHAERRLIMRTSFYFLARVVTSIDSAFAWHPDTAQRIKDLAFRNCPAQVFTYLITAPKTPAGLMGFFRAILSVPYSDRKLHWLLCDDLGIEVQSRRGPDGVQTLLLIFRKAGRIAWSVNFYDKLAKAADDAEMIHVKVGDKSVRDFLSRALRVDVTIHEAGQAEMHHEAKLSSRENASITCADYCRAIRVMDQGEGRSGKKFVRWMLDHIFGELMKLWSLLSYAPSRLKEVEKILEDYNDDAAAGFIEWYLNGFEYIDPDGDQKRSVSFMQFLEHHAERKVSRDIARRSREKLFAKNVDPDIRLRAYDAFFNQTFIWDLTDDDRHKLALANEAGDFEAAGKLQNRSRRNSVEVNKEITGALTKMIASAHTPANTLGAAKEVT
jgi:hypothetical protein